MFEIKAKDKLVERALLVGAYLDTDKKADAQGLLAELEELVDTLGLPVIERMLVHHRENHPRYLIGSGKAQEIVDLAKKLECDVLVFDNELSPSQQRNWEELAGMTVADRQEIILDIFGARAQTREARIQVDLARMSYSLPRLTRAWSHLGQQGGGIGAKGEGESQLEQDKRKIRLQIDRLKRELVAVRSSRATQRKDRKQMLVVFNKIDKVSDSAALFALRRHFPDAVSVSAKTGEGMPELIDRISEFVARGTLTISLRLPAERADLLARLHREGSVHNLKYDEGFTLAAATIPRRSLELFAPLIAVTKP